jgi:hypothetical protein
VNFAHRRLIRQSNNIIGGHSNLVVDAKTSVLYGAGFFIVIAAGILPHFPRLHSTPERHSSRPIGYNWSTECSASSRPKQEDRDREILRAYEEQNAVRNVGWTRCCRIAVERPRSCTASCRSEPLPAVAAWLHLPWPNASWLKAIPGGQRPRRRAATAYRGRHRFAGFVRIALT